MVEISTDRLPTMKPIDEWFALTLPDSQMKDELGSLRLRLKYIVRYQFTKLFL